MGIVAKIGEMIGASVPDYLLLLTIVGLFWFFLKSGRAMRTFFQKSLADTSKTLTDKIDANASGVKEHLDYYNGEQERHWGDFTKLIEKLERDKVWKDLYNSEISHLKDMGITRDKRLDIVEECLRNSGDERRNGHMRP